jgi:hypothetical protein
LQFVNNISEGWFSYFVSNVFLYVNLTDESQITQKLIEGNLHVCGDLFNQRITLGVNRRSVQGVSTAGHFEKASGLLEGFWAKTGNREESGAGLECTLVFSMVYNLFGEGGADSGDEGEEGSAGSVEVNADMIDAALDYFR